MNFDQSSIKILYFMITSIITFSVGLSLYQYILVRKKIFLLSFLYWGSILISSFINLFVPQIESDLYLISIMGTFISNLVLANVMFEIQKKEFRRNIFILINLLLFSFYFVLRRFGVSFEWCFFILLFGASVPIFYAFYQAIKLRNLRLTQVQKIFTFFSFLMAIHYCDYPIFRNNPDYYGVASIIAVVLIFSLATLMPMVVNELEWIDRNNNLENEIQMRVQELRQKDLQVWEAEKLSSIGRLSGVLAHEFNTPLATISAAAASIQKFCSETNQEGSVSFRNSTLIKKAVAQTAQLTENLKKAAGDRLGLNQADIFAHGLVEEIDKSISELAYSKSFKFLSMPFEGSDFTFIANKDEISHALRLCVIYLISRLDQKDNNFQLALRGSGDERKIFFLGSKMKFDEVENSSSDRNGVVLSLDNNSDFNLAVIKSLLVANNAELVVLNKHNATELQIIF